MAEVEVGVGEAIDGLSVALWETLQSKNVSDSNGEDANIVDVVASLASGLNSVAQAIERVAAAIEHSGRL